MIKIDKKIIKNVLDMLKGVAPANYDSMKRIVYSCDVLEAFLSQPEEEENAEEVTDHG